jgi:uncharacterized membrane protein YedE/YeeE
MKSYLAAFASGIVFALGLGLAGMTRPVKVIGFLDFFGAWDASLAMVMIGAIIVYSVFYRWARALPRPLLVAKFSVPTRTDFDADLILGSALFGVGWGLAGFCPGPALVSLASGAVPVIIFVAAMVTGMYLHGWLTQLRTTKEIFNIVITDGVQDA